MRIYPLTPSGKGSIFHELHFFRQCDLVRENWLFGISWLYLESFNDPVIQAFVPFDIQKPPSLIGYSDENCQWNYRESGRRCAVKTATIPVKTARGECASRGDVFILSPFLLFGQALLWSPKKPYTKQIMQKSVDLKDGIVRPLWTQPA